MRHAAAAGIVLLGMLCGAARATGAAGAGEADNVRTAGRYFAAMQAGRFDAPAALFAPDFVAHGVSISYGLEQELAATVSWHAAMPDLKVTVERTVAAGDMVAVHWQASGTNTVAAGGMPGKGGRVGLEGMTFFRFAGGRIAEEWSVVDVASLRRLFGHPPEGP